MTRPIGSYRHPRTSRLHQGHLLRLRGYIRGGLSGSEIGRLCGVDRAYVYHLARRWREALRLGINRHAEAEGARR